VLNQLFDAVASFFLEKIHGSVRRIPKAKHHQFGEKLKLRSTAASLIVISASHVHATQEAIAYLPPQ